MELGNGLFMNFMPKAPVPNEPQHTQHVPVYSCSTFSTQPDFIAFDKDWNHAQPAMSLSISLVESGSLRVMGNLESHVM